MQHTKIRASSYVTIQNCMVFVRIMAAGTATRLDTIKNKKSPQQAAGYWWQKGIRSKARSKLRGICPERDLIDGVFEGPNCPPAPNCAPARTRGARRAISARRRSSGVRTAVWPRQTDRSSIDPRGSERDGGPPSLWPPPLGNISGMGESGADNCEVPWDVAWGGLTARTGRTHSGVTDRPAREVGDNMVDTMPPEI